MPLIQAIPPINSLTSVAPPQIDVESILNHFIRLCPTTHKHCRMLIQGLTLYAAMLNCWHNLVSHKVVLFFLAKSVLLHFTRTVGPRTTGQLFGSGQLGLGQLGPGAQLSGAQLSGAQFA